MSRTYDVVVIGAGSAGIAAAAGARDTNKTSSILIVNSEERPPYDRRRLSKPHSESTGVDVSALYPEEWYTDQNIERIDGTSVESVDPVGKSVTVKDETIGFRSLIIATGAAPAFPKLVRPHERGSFSVLRNAEEAEELLKRASSAKTILIAGMGVLAVEVAQRLVAMGKRVTLAGATAQLIPRQLSARASELLEESMTRQKVKLLFQEEIISFEKNRKHSWSVEMLKHSDHYDMVVFCIGVTPVVDIARSAGLDIGTGILVNEYQQTSASGVYAAGECAELPTGRISFLWEEAAAQGRVAGVNAVGGDAAFEDTGFPLKTTVFGIEIYSNGKPRRPWNFRIDEFEIEERYYAFYWTDEGRLSGAIVVNDPNRTRQIGEAIVKGLDRDSFDREISIG